MGDFIQFTQHHSVQYNGQTKKLGRILSTVALVQTNIEACTTVQREHAAIKGSGTYGRILKEKPDNAVQVMFKKISSLGLFVEGPLRHKKIRRLNTLTHDYGINLLAGCETRTDL